MTIRIHNSLGRTKEDFRPLDPNKVRMYVCGITAYDRCHIGHARSAVVFDVVVRHLRRQGYDVIFVRNFTDIDDKIILRAREEGVTTTELAEREIRHFTEDMDALGVLPADVEPRATQHIPEIVSLIETLMASGHAYEASGSVYFSVRSFPAYGALSGRNIEELLSGARILPGEEKRDPLDFALWKASKPGEPEWESPWGKGRPGWHIECSAMAMKYLGPTIDIHGGGLDLIFPHHENEKAQSEAATGRPFVRYWMHNGFVTIRGEKMSKSLGNFVTIREILSVHHPEAIRLFLLSKHYRSPLDYSEELLAESEAALERCYAALAEAKRAMSSCGKKDRPLTDDLNEAASMLESLGERFDLAMSDDFNTASAIGHLFEGVRALNRLSQSALKAPSRRYHGPLAAGIAAIRETAGTLGILTQDPEAFLRRKNLDALARLGMDEAGILAAIERRASARAARDWTAADAVRSELERLGILLQDGPEGTTWTMKRLTQGEIQGGQRP